MNYCYRVLFLSPCWQRWNELEFLRPLPGHVRWFLGQTPYGFWASGWHRWFTIVRHGRVTARSADPTPLSVDF